MHVVSSDAAKLTGGGTEKILIEFFSFLAAGLSGCLLNNYWVVDTHDDLADTMLNMLIFTFHSFAKIASHS